VSFIVANRNYARFLDQCIRSILDQPYQQKSLIVVDDGSDDDSWAVMEQYKERALCLRQEFGKRGQSMAWNLAFPHVDGEWVWFVDSDDFLVPGILPRVAAQLDPAYAMFYGEMTRVAEGGERLGKKYQKPFDDYEGALWPQLIEEGCLFLPPTSSLIFKSAALHQWMPIARRCCIGGADDYLRRQVGFEGPVKKIHESICCYRVHSKSHTLRGWTSVSLRQAYLVEIQGYHYVKMRSKKLGIGHPPRRAQIDMPHAILAILMGKLRGRSCTVSLSDVRIAFAREKRLHPLKRLFYLGLGVAISITPAPVSLWLVQRTWQYRFQRCLKAGRGHS
jgi:glycosyltransferase involved in cell wall biosynthesis